MLAGESQPLRLVVMAPWFRGSGGGPWRTTAAVAAAADTQCWHKVHGTTTATAVTLAVSSFQKASRERSGMGPSDSPL